MQALVEVSIKISSIAFNHVTELEFLNLDVIPSGKF
jgi:hypothetical protein